MHSALLGVMRDHASQALPRVVSEYMIGSMVDFPDPGVGDAGGVGVAGDGGVSRGDGRIEAGVHGPGVEGSEQTAKFSVTSTSAATAAEAVPPISAAPSTVDQGATLDTLGSDMTVAAGASSAFGTSAERPSSPSSHVSPSNHKSSSQAPHSLSSRSRSRSFSASEDVHEGSGGETYKDKNSCSYGHGYGPKNDGRSQQIPLRGWSSGAGSTGSEKPLFVRGTSARALPGSSGWAGAGSGSFWSPSLTAQSTSSRTRPWSLRLTSIGEPGQGVVGSSPRHVLFQQQEHMVRGILWYCALCRPGGYKAI